VTKYKVQENARDKNMMAHFSCQKCLEESWKTVRFHTGPRLNFPFYLPEVKTTAWEKKHVGVHDLDLLSRKMVAD
jgi:hypothetical protein